MSWIKLDDGFPQNPKIVGLSDRAFRDYISGLCYSGRYLTDGFLPQAIISKIKGTKELINCGLWEQIPDGIQIKNYTEYQTPKDEVERKKEQTRNRVTRYREKSNADVTLPEYRIQNTEIKDGNPEGLAIQELVTLYFDHYPKEGLKPSGNMVAGQIKQAMKQVTFEELKKLVTIVAQDGMILTRNTLLIAQKRTLEPRNQPTPIPARFEAKENPKATPMPDFIKDMFKGVSDLP